MHSFINSARFLNRQSLRCQRLPAVVLAVACALSMSSVVFAASDRSPLVVVSKATTDTVIKQVPLTGTVTSARVAQLSTEVSGLVKKVNVEVGDRVETGAELLELDREIEQLIMAALQAATRQARAELADAKRRYEDAELLRKQKSISENELRLLEAEVEVDKSMLIKQQADERRQQARVERHTLLAPFDGVII